MFRKVFYLNPGDVVRLNGSDYIYQYSDLAPDKVRQDSTGTMWLCLFVKKGDPDNEYKFVLNKEDFVHVVPSFYSVSTV